MSYETQYYHDKGTTGPTGKDGPMGDAGKKGKTGVATEQTQVPIIQSRVDTMPLIFTTVNDGTGTVVGSGTLTRIRTGSVTFYKLSAVLPTNDPPTIANNASKIRYYARLTDKSWYNSTMGGFRGTDDGLAVFEIGMISRFEYASLQFWYYGSGGNGIINTLLE